MLSTTLKTMGVAIFRSSCNLAYRLFCMFPRKNMVVFVSRQTNSPTKDFQMIGEEFAKYGYDAVYLTKKLSKKTAGSYVPHIVRELWLLARCRACFLDRYDPVVSLLNFECDHADKVSLYERGLHSDFPSQPVIVQLWHAFGAFKYFGYQSLDTCEGHSTETAKLFGIHRNYSWIICTGEGCRHAFAQAFAYPIERVVALGRPEFSLLMQESKCRNKPMRGDKKTILFAPTLRKSKLSEHPLRELYQSGLWKALESSANIAWSFHPLEETGIASGDVNKLLLEADYVITDYSSIVYEAYLLGVNAIFYVPDIEQYKVSPGLNINPREVCPEISFVNDQELLKYLNDLVSGATTYPSQAFARFVGDVFDNPLGSPEQTIAEFVLDKVNTE